MASVSPHSRFEDEDESEERREPPRRRRPPPDRPETSRDFPTPRRTSGKRRLCFPTRVLPWARRAHRTTRIRSPRKTPSSVVGSPSKPRWGRSTKTRAGGPATTRAAAAATTMGSTTRPKMSARSRGGTATVRGRAPVRRDERRAAAPGASPPPPPTSRVTGWSDPKSQMYAGIKQKIMTRILMEARRRDAAAEKAAAAETARVGEKRPRDVPSRSRDVLRPETPSRGVHTRAFFSRYWSYAEWMVLWHVELLDDRRAMLRFGTAEDVLAWGTRRSRSEAAPPGASARPRRCSPPSWITSTGA